MVFKLSFLLSIVQVLPATLKPFSAYHLVFSVLFPLIRIHRLCSWILLDWSVRLQLKLVSNWSLIGNLQPMMSCLTTIPLLLLLALIFIPSQVFIRLATMSRRKGPLPMYFLRLVNMLLVLQSWMSKMPIVIVILLLTTLDWVVSARHLRLTSLDLA